MSRKTVDWEDYARWIAEKYVCMNNWEEYWDLILALHNIDFDTEDEEDRARDGRSLRNTFIEDSGWSVFDDEILENECSVLEALAALAVRLDHEYIGDHMVTCPEDYEENKEYRLFFRMIENLELDDMFNDNFDENIVEDAIDIWLNREYDRHGYGSIFPVKRERRNMRGLSIWDQAMIYINEMNY